MVHDLVHKIPVMTYHYDTSGEIGQILLKNLQCNNVKIIGRLVENQEIGVPHQHRAQIQFATLATAQLVYIIVLLFRCEQKMLQKL